MTNARRTSRTILWRVRDASPLLVTCRPVEEVVGRIGHERLTAGIRRDVTTRRGCQPSDGIQSLNEGRHGQRAASRQSLLDASRRRQEPGNRVRIDRSGTGDPGSNRARVPRVLPRGADEPIRERSGAELEGIGAEEMGGELLSLLTE